VCVCHIFAVIAKLVALLIARAAVAAVPVFVCATSLL